LKFSFRVDASYKIGSGHIIRCLNLAVALQELGHEVIFICRNLEGNMNSFLKAKGFKVFVLKKPINNDDDNDRTRTENWLEVPQKNDAIETYNHISEFKPDWMIIDHYAIDDEWIDHIRNNITNIAVIDDLFNRKISANLYINSGGQLLPLESEMINIIDCKYKLLGPKYTLLNESFRKARKFALFERKKRTKVENILVYMGGYDQSNSNLVALKSILKSKYSKANINIVSGFNKKQNKILKEFINFRENIKIHFQTKKMHRLISKADIAITSCGMITWEKACLGLPSLAITTAENQLQNAKFMNEIGAHKFIGNAKNISEDKILFELNSLGRKDLEKMSNLAADIIDGEGVRRIINHLINS
jgi:UDP-2,4-diacetamido-2,4,6-trideoxy-beta-L-altropyranose hydrolase